MTGAEPASPRGARARGRDPDQPRCENGKGGERRGRDSNPRIGLTPINRLAGGCLQPLGHLSARGPYRSGRSAGRLAGAAPGGVAERSNAAVLKTAAGFTGPGVRIPPPPLFPGRHESTAPTDRRCVIRSRPAQNRSAGVSTVAQSSRSRGSEVGRAASYAAAVPLDPSRSGASWRSPTASATPERPPQRTARVAQALDGHAARHGAGHARPRRRRARPALDPARAGARTTRVRWCSSPTTAIGSAERSARVRARASTTACLASRSSASLRAAARAGGGCSGLGASGRRRASRSMPIVPCPAGMDGEALMLDPPLAFASGPESCACGLRARTLAIASAQAPEGVRAGVIELGRIALGRDQYPRRQHQGITRLQGCGGGVQG